MKIIISNNNQTIGIVKDFQNMDKGLIGQTIAELEIIKKELIELYSEEI